MSHAAAYQFGEFVLDMAQERLLRGEGAPIELTPRLFATLRLLVQRNGQLVDKRTLTDHVWPGLVVGDNSLSQVIAGLRRILGDNAQDSLFIQTVPRKGFRFVATVMPVAMQASHDSSLAPVTIANATPLAGVRNGRHSDREISSTGLAAGVAAKLAVLPFKLVGTHDHRTLLDVGMADSLIARLSVLPGIVLLAPGSVDRFGDGDRDPVRAAAELGARWVVDGSVQRVGDRLRVAARLLGAGDGAVIWADVLDRDAAGLFELQDYLATVIARALTGTPRAPSRMNRVDLGGTRNIDAYQLYLAAAWRAQGGRSADIARSIDLVQQALAIDARYAQAWALLGWVHRRRLWNADALPAEVFEISDAAVQKAIALAPNLALAHAGIGFSRFWYAYDWTGAEREFRLALASNPSESNAQWGLSFLLLTQGRIDEGFAHLRLARELDPLSPILHTLEASFLTAAGQYPAARRRVQGALDIAPNLWLAHAALGRLLLVEKKTDAGLAELRRAVALGSDTVRPKAHLAMQLALHDHSEEAQAILADIRQRATLGHVPPTSIAMILAALGQTQSALDELERAYELRDTRLVELRGDPCWHPLRDQPRFAALLRRLKLDGPGGGLSSI